MFRGNPQGLKPTIGSSLTARLKSCAPGSQKSRFSCPSQRRNGAISNATPLNTTDQLHQSRNCWVQGSGGAEEQRGKVSSLRTPAPPPLCSPSRCVGVSVAKSG